MCKIYRYAMFIGRPAELPPCLGFLHVPVKSASGMAPVASFSWFSLCLIFLAPLPAAVAIAQGPPPPPP